MDLTKTLQTLYAEKERVERMIESLEDLQAALSGTRRNQKRPGRKSMGASERRQVAERMKKYWARRKSLEEQRANPAPTTGAAAD
jgi:hypothetical protein